MNSCNPSFAKDKLAYAYDLVSALAHPVRLQIIEYIDRKGETNVKKIYKDLDLEQSITSQHLKVLRDVDVVGYTKDGKFVYYFLNYPVLERVEKAMKSYNAIESMRVQQA